MTHPYFRCWMITSVNFSGFSPNGMCIVIVEIWFGIAYGQILSIYDGNLCLQMSIFSFSDDNFSKCQWIFTKLGMCIDIV